MKKKIIGMILLSFVLMAGCCEPKSKSGKKVAQKKEITEEQRVLKRFNSLLPPVILITKTNDGWDKYDITVIDGVNKMHSFSKESTFIRGLGQNYSVRDTLVFKSGYSD